MIKQNVLLAVLLALTTNVFAQDLTFGKFLGSISPTKFIGNATNKGYEQQVEIIEVTTTGQSRGTTVSLKFSPCPASADFITHTQLGKLISKGQVEILEKNPSNPAFTRVKYKIYFEDARINSCTDTKACNNQMATTVTLNPQRICWLYYNYEPASGKISGTTTNGFDLKSGQAWTVTPYNF
ncbi:MAG: hypothetical protein J0L67_15005 [Cytophagales bacterium]|nr:hypothetical protein [Cytophagales bacterium]